MGCPECRQPEDIMESEPIVATLPPKQINDPITAQTSQQRGSDVPADEYRDAPQHQMFPARYHANNGGIANIDGGQRQTARRPSSANSALGT